MARIWLAAPVAAALLATPALAQDAPDGWSVGAVGLITNTPYVGEDTQLRALPSISYRNGRFSLGVTGLSYSVFDQNGSQVDLILAPRFSALSDADAPELAGIDRDFTVDAGLRYSVSFANGANVRATLRQEITGEHDGQEIDLRGTQRWGNSGLPIGVYAGATWRSSDLSNYLYGVTPSEAIVGRPAYDTGSTLTPYVGVSGFIPLSENWGLIGSLQADFLGDAITDSPIVEDDTVISATVGVTFRF